MIVGVCLGSGTSFDSMNLSSSALYPACVTRVPNFGLINSEVLFRVLLALRALL